jgi:acetate kinase
VYGIKKAIGAFAAALGGIDTLVFSGGIGEHAPEIRDRICEGLAFLGISIDAERNRMDGPVISVPDTRVTVRVISTDEELMIARAAHRLLASR